uniref:Uncharacterized protein n=1 Tax=Arundo donax TaxID=35708 RepID=A0A0A9A9E7_ARUDO
MLLELCRHSNKPFRHHSWASGHLAWPCTQMRTYFECELVETGAPSCAACRNEPG